MYKKISILLIILLMLSALIIGVVLMKKEKISNSQNICMHLEIDYELWQYEKIENDSCFFINKETGEIGQYNIKENKLYIELIDKNVTVSGSSK